MTEIQTEAKSSRNPRIKRDYLDVDKAGNVSSPEDSVNPKLIRFYEPDMDERGANFDMVIRDYPKALLAFSTCHGIAQVSGDQFNKRAIEAEDGSLVDWSWENVVRYLRDRHTRFELGKWGMSDPGEGQGKTTLWKLAFHNNMDRYVSANDTEAIEFYSGMMGMDTNEFADRANRVSWLNDTATDEAKTAIRDSQDVDLEKKRIAAEKAAPAAPSSFDFRK